MNALASQVAAWCGGRLIGADALLVGVGQDSRTLQPGALFVALRGEHGDGHDYVAAVVGRAGAALVERELPLALPQIVVADALAALQKLARAWLDTLDARRVALTGSNGKTTTKALTAAILTQIAHTHATPGNFNNEIGVPLTLLALRADHRYAVIEMGCGKPGDIDELAAIAPPHVALVTNVAAAHLERLGSEEGVARAKAGIYRGLLDGGIAVINADDAFAHYFREQAGAHRVIDFAIDGPAAVRAEKIEIGLKSGFRLATPAGSVAIELPLPGRHNIMNALAASSLALAVGTPLDAIAAGLAQAAAVGGRQHRLAVRGGVIYDDSYNANPGSLSAAIETLALEPSPRWLVLGDMAELGPQASTLHALCGALARARGIERLYAVGPLSLAAADAFGDGAQHYARVETLIDELQSQWRPGTTALVKGSRSARMERVVAALAGSAVGGGAH
ncbi:MAG: UDP-N-acetylmuramoyl-tripeptide--D-alanyl-D-alanine ligase [Rhodanobacteraceae bacterium]|nr:UDP-N-acetylmuramoyl-tripeptide--D-alanyl-D-alanine ligase [Rhodanobacteraceae bacterium]